MEMCFSMQPDSRPHCVIYEDRNYAKYLFSERGMFSGLSYTVRYQQINVCFIHIYQVNLCGIDIVIYVRSPDLIFSFFFFTLPLQQCTVNEMGYTVLKGVMSRLTYKVCANASLVFVYTDKL